MSEYSLSNTPLEAGSYEIIKSRLDKSRDSLEEKLLKLNESRKLVFGGTETTLKSTVRIHTDNNCIAQDIIAFEDRCIFGFNVHIGLRSVTKMSDVFAVYRYENDSFIQDDFSIIHDSQFEQDLENLYKYYRHSEFYRFWSKGAYFYMIFKVTEKEGDYKAFKWLVNGSELKYIDNRSEHEYKIGNQYAFEWIKTTRDDFRNGQHPHISIQDRVFVEAVGGDLTIKVEDNTDDGKGIYRELVTEKDQQLDDAEVSFADLGSLIALRIKSYLEDPRYFIYNEKLEEVFKLDAMAESCQLLPGDQGIIVSNGYYLKTGLNKKFESDISKKRHETTFSSLNGEDHMYVYYDPLEGRYVLMSYNVISQVVDTPMSCSGYGIFADGTLGFFRRDPEPVKHHTIQLWSTPYGKNLSFSSAHEEHLLYKVGNKEIVSFMSECSSLITLIKKETLYTDLYQDIVNLCVNINDSYYWINSEEALHISSIITEVQEASEVAIGEYQKVISIRNATSEATSEVQRKAKKLFKEIDILSLDDIMTFVRTLTSLRELRGEMLSIKEMRYANIELVDILEAEAEEKNLQLEKSCVRFLLTETSLESYKKRIDSIEKSIAKIKTSVQCNERGDEAEQIGKDLELLIDIVGNLKINDPTETTQIIEQISTLYSHLNGVRSRIRQHYKEIRRGESQAEFDAQLRLLEQSVISALEVAQTPESCTESLNRIMLILEEIEGKFVDQDIYVTILLDKREEIHSAFETRRLQLVETLNRRTIALAKSGQRLIEGISKRAHKLEGPKAINGFYASDMMTQKVRSIIEELKDLGDAIKADDLSSQLKSSKEEVLRSLRDKTDLYVGGDNVIQFGQHQFSINTQALELTILPVEGTLNVHLTGTNFFQKIDDAAFARTSDFWDQIYISENENIYRGEYLLYQFILENGGLEKLDSKSLEDSITQFSSKRLNEGYEKGIHNKDASAIGKALLEIRKSIGLLRYSGSERAWGRFYWEFGMSLDVKKFWLQKIETAKSILENFPHYIIHKELSKELRAMMMESSFISLFTEANSYEAASYIIESLIETGVAIVSQDAVLLAKDFGAHLKMIKANDNYKQPITELAKYPLQQFEYVKNWLEAYISGSNKEDDHETFQEAIVHLIATEKHKIIEGSCTVEIENLLGEHPLIERGFYKIKYHQYFKKVKNYSKTTVPRILSFKSLKHEHLEKWKRRLRLEEFKPRVLSTFIRNQLIDNVYLPIIGDNLAKQIGSVGDQSRTDRMGLLLLVSPPGYGKTTLMEYVADRLGLTFVKINGPSIGHDITSLDPSNAQSSGARQELEKLNLSFEIGDNIMIYLDDIQHCSSEFLQKFISLTDGQRKIEGTYNGISKTYDFRGKKVAVVMAGNPYTEAGEKFHVPDMLANRADVYNLGDMLSGTESYFNNSYVENALSSSPYLQRMAAKSLKDVYTLLSHMKSDDLSGIQLEGSHTPEEMNEYSNVLRKLLAVRDVVLLVNQSYIKSAAINDAYRIEPPFKLQGSYRNMNKMAEKIVPVMNDAEVESLIMDHYKGEVQTLTNNSEANFLLFKRLNNKLSSEDEARLTYITKTYQEDKAERSGDFIKPVIREIKDFNEILKSIRDEIGKKNI